MLKPLPVSTSTFRDIVAGGFLYVDKTRYIHELIRETKGAYFLARPRRFGKSLLISTLAEIFQGNKELFQGLWLYHSSYEWARHPVIRFDFSQEQVATADELKDAISAYLQEIAQEQGIALAPAPHQRQFRWLIKQLAVEKQVVILVDEYDKPIIDNLENLAEAKRIRTVLKGFYGVIKAMDAHVRFVFLTGISKFSKVAVFSDLNNLVDLTLNRQFAVLCGLTEEEISTALSDYLHAFAAKEKLDTPTFLARVREWYDGFCFAGGASNVYNPYSTLLLFYHQNFANYWFESGTPTFLIKLIKEREYDIRSFNRLVLQGLNFNTYEIEQLEVIPLLFQTGYLTIKDYAEDGESGIYTLAYPNYEVESAFVTYLLTAFTQLERDFASGYLFQLIGALQRNQLPRFFEILNVFFANIPYTLHVKREKYYQTIFYLIFKLIGLNLEAEVTTNQGRIDAVIELPERIVIFEFKLDGSADDALTQIRNRAYYQKYQGKGKELVLVGVNFASQSGKVAEWKVGTTS